MAELVSTVLESIKILITLSKAVHDYKELPVKQKDRMNIIELHTMALRDRAEVVQSLRSQPDVSEATKDSLTEMLKSAANILQQVTSYVRRWDRRCRADSNGELTGRNGVVGAPLRARAFCKMCIFRALCVSWSGKEMDRKITALHNIATLLHDQIIIATMLDVDSLAWAENDVQKLWKEMKPDSYQCLLPLDDTTARGTNSPSHMGMTRNLSVGSTGVAERHLIVSRRSFNTNDATGEPLTQDEKATQTERVAHVLKAVASFKGFDKQAVPVGVMKCKGFTADRGSGCSLVFELPSNADRSTLRTLRQLLTFSADPPKHSLSDRLRVACSLAKTVALIHSLGLVHKSISPETIVFFESDVNTDPSKAFPHTLSTPYLIGFDQAREDSGRSGKINYDASMLAFNMYIHPDHLGDQRRRTYQMMDDTYSLGVCLLEIGLWTPLFLRGNSTEPDDFIINEAFLDLRNENVDRRVRQTYAHSTEGLSPTSRDLGIERRKMLLGRAKEALPQVMGDTYTEVVISCLECNAEETQGNDSRRELSSATTTLRAESPSTSTEGVEKLMYEHKSLEAPMTSNCGISDICNQRLENGNLQSLTFLRQVLQRLDKLSSTF